MDGRRRSGGDDVQCSGPTVFALAADEENGPADCPVRCRPCGCGYLCSTNCGTSRLICAFIMRIEGMSNGEEIGANSIDSYLPLREVVCETLRAMRSAREY